MPAIAIKRKIKPIKSRPFFSLRGPWIYISFLGIAGFPLFVNFVGMPLVVHGLTTPIGPATPQAQPGIGTFNLLRDINAQGFGAQDLGRITHGYLAGRGTVLAFAGDNVQIFEYPSNEIARTEASAAFKRSPRLATLGYFHLYLQGNLIGLYFGHNAGVLKIMEDKFGSPVPTTNANIGSAY